MLLRSFPILLYLLLLAAPVRAERLDAADEPDFIHLPRQLAVKILRGNSTGAQFIGSGFAWVSHGHAFAITNAHVAARGLPLEPAPAGLFVGFAESVGNHAASATWVIQAADLAIIETDVVTDNPNPYSLGSAALDDTVYSISYDQEEFQQASPVVFKGKVVGIVGVLYPSSVLILKPPVPPDAVKAYVIEGSNCIFGASGGMVLNSKGEVVAYNTGTIGNGLCIAVSIDEVTRALAR